MEKKSDTDGSEHSLVKAKYQIDTWNPKQVAAVAIAATEAGYDVEYEKIGKDETAMILLGNGDNLKFNNIMMRILCATVEDSDEEEKD